MAYRDYARAASYHRVDDSDIQRAVRLIDRIKELSPRGLSDAEAAKIALLCEADRRNNLLAELGQQFGSIFQNMAYDLNTDRI